MIQDDDDNLVGLLSETDILRGFIEATGIQDGSFQFVIEMPDQPGSTSQVIDLIRKRDARVLSILTSFSDAPRGSKTVAIRISVDESTAKELGKEINSMENYNIVYQGKDELHNLPTKRK